MKTIFTIAASILFASFAGAQETHDRLQQDPPAVTQAQVERDAQLAADHRKRNEETKKAQENALKNEAENATANNAATKNRKVSTLPGKQ